jgi:hypothetical protein
MDANGEFDHMGQPPLPAGPDHASFAILRGLIDRGPHLDRTVRRL